MPDILHCVELGVRGKTLLISTELRLTFSKCKKKVIVVPKMASQPLLEANTVEVLYDLVLNHVQY